MTDRTNNILKIVEAVDRLAYARVSRALVPAPTARSGCRHSAANARQEAINRARAHLHDVLDEVLPGKPVCQPTKPETITVTDIHGCEREIPVNPKPTGCKGRPSSKDPLTLEMLFGDYGLCPVEFCFGGWSKDVTYKGSKIATIRKRDQEIFTHSMPDPRGFTVEKGVFPSLKAAFAAVVQVNEEKRKGNTDADLI